MPKLVLTTFTVRGKGKFPVDMLRYDKCWPASMDDAAVMEDLIVEPVVGRVDIKLTSISRPTYDRWKSYGWYVLSD